VKVPRGLDRPPGPDMSRGRFGTMFARVPRRELSDDALAALLQVMRETGSLGDNPSIPAGYTHLGQFIDHDITFDPTSLLDKIEDPHALGSFRTPRFDLDSLYGSGPEDQPFLYESRGGPDDGVRLLVGAEPDLPRNQDGRALIGDPRNDESIIVAQLHLLFLRFHNKVVDHLRTHDDLEDTELFREARRTVCWHYQWIVAHDFLPRVVGEDMVDAAMQERTCYTCESDPFIPVEFSGAAYRFGHSMVRDTYDLKRATKGVAIFADEDDPASNRHLGGFRGLRG
jgi:hypothetical protein